jgi:hypothetical protein
MMQQVKRIVAVTFLMAIAMGATGCTSMLVGSIKVARELTGLAFDVAERTTKLSVQSTKNSIEVASKGVDLAGKLMKIVEDDRKNQLAQK